MSIIFQELSPEQEGEAVSRTQESDALRPPTAGDCIYLIGAQWFNEWCQYTGYTYDRDRKKLVLSSKLDHDVPKHRPGPINNSDILDLSAATGDLTQDELTAAAPLKKDLQPQKDYWELREGTWGMLKEWYVQEREEENTITFLLATFQLHFACSSF